MALPPERVSIKRKRDAEAVDVLFIQDKKKARFRFEKVASDAKPEFLQPQPPIVPSSAPTAPVASRPSTASSDTAKRPDGTKRVALREFRLNRPIADGRVRKIGFSKKDDVATFLETRASQKVQAQKVPDLKPQPAVGAEKLLRTPQKRLRPRASAAEIEWRERNWGSASGSRSTSRAPVADPNDPEELKLAQLLNDFALESNKPAPKISLPTKTVLDSPLKPKTPLKFQPKPAPPRGRQQNLPGSGTSSGNDSESESDYEYDTYIRVPVQDDEMDIDKPSHDPALAGKSLGVLVIEDEDEELWATYAMDEDEQLEFDTDEEDENAEDYHGNDYPEDELASDDEFNRAAYGYRHAFSDEEEFGNEDDEPDWSDAEDRLSSSRVAVGSHSALPWENEFSSPVQHGGRDPY